MNHSASKTVFNLKVKIKVKVLPNSDITRLSLDRGRI